MLETVQRQFVILHVPFLMFGCGVKPFSTWSLNFCDCTLSKESPCRILQCLQFKGALVRPSPISQLQQLFVFAVGWVEGPFFVEPEYAVQHFGGGFHHLEQVHVLGADHAFAQHVAF